MFEEYHEEAVAWCVSKKLISVTKMVFPLNTEHIGNLGERSHGSDFFLWSSHLEALQVKQRGLSMLRESILTPDALSPAGVAGETLCSTGKSS